MTDAIQGAGASQPARTPGAARAANSAPFRALLEQIERSAESLSRKSQDELSRESLGDAVQEARASLEQVLTLKERLLEEWRASQRAGGV